jgi:hypothetical protein
MNKNEISEPQPYHVQQGRLLMTKDTEKLQTRQQREYDYQEQLRMFKDFTELDQGKSRTFLATFNSPQECADFVTMHNRLIDKIDLLEYELREALDELKMHGV